MTDELTGLFKAASFLTQAEALLDHSSRAVLVVMDMDHFKRFNDEHGHVAGDALIHAVAQRFAQAMAGEGVLVARYGGDEFVALLPGEDLYTVYDRAEALRAALQAGLSLTLDGQAVHSSVSVAMGLVDYPAGAGDVGGLIEKAKSALLQAKIDGGNSVRFYEERDTLSGVYSAAATQRALEDALAQAKAGGQFLSAFLLDIDDFSRINREFGHRAGDEVLARLGTILRRNFSEPNIVGRLAGDMFAVILPGQGLDTAYLLAEEVRRLVEDGQIEWKMGAQTSTLRFHISGGVAGFPGDASERVDLLRKAEEALFRAKRSGRNRVALAATSQMVTKTSHYSQTQLERLGELARKESRTEAFLLREALDDLLRKYDQPGEK